MAFHPLRRASRIPVLPPDPVVPAVTVPVSGLVAAPIPASVRSCVPAHIVEAAHTALHASWGGAPVTPAPSGLGCSECAPDLTGVVALLWKHVAAGRSVPGWVHVEASRVLHAASAIMPTPPDNDAPCSGCLDDVGAIADGILDATRTAAA